MIADLQRARDDLLDQSAGTVVRPGLVSRRMRALQRMQGQIEQATRTMADLSTLNAPDVAAALLSAWPAATPSQSLPQQSKRGGAR